MVENDSSIELVYGSKKDDKVPSYTLRQRIFILICICTTNVGAPLASHIYYPSLVAVKTDLQTSITAVNASVSIYKLTQAIAPVFFASVSDIWGRRPVYMLLSPIGIGACVGLALAPTIGCLIGFRVLQAIGTSPLFSIGYGVISDITDSASRSLYLSMFYTSFRTFTLAGPVIGGVVAQHLSWRYNFWILLCTVGASSLIIILFLPETLPSLVSKRRNLTPFQWIHGRSTSLRSSSHGDSEKSPLPSSNQEKESRDSRKSIQNLALAIQNFRRKHLLAAFLLTGLYNAAQDCYNVTTVYLFTSYFKLDEQNVGLCYLAQSVGGLIGGIFAGVYLRHCFKKAAQWYCKDVPGEISTDDICKARQIPYEFPICGARLKPVLLNAFIVQAVTAIYGWCYIWGAPLPVMLCLLFFVGFNFPIVDQGVSTLTMDFRPGEGATVGATANIFNYGFGAIASLCINPLIEAVGVGMAFTTVSLVLVMGNLLILLLLRFGGKWREACDTKESRQTENPSST